jgi:hypothetical protein
MERMKLNGTHDLVVFSDYNNLWNMDFIAVSRETDVLYVDINLLTPEFYI